LTVAPRERDCVFHGIDIPPQDTGESHDCRKFGLDGIVDPLIQRIRVPAAQNSAKAHCQATHHAERF